MKTIGNTIKNSMGKFKPNKNAIKNLAFGMQKQGQKQLRTSHNIGSRSSEQVRGKEFGSLINMVSKSKSYVPLLFAGGLTQLASFNLVATDGEIDLKDKKQEQTDEEIEAELKKLEEGEKGEKEPEKPVTVLPQKKSLKPPKIIITEAMKQQQALDLARSKASAKPGSAQFWQNKFEQLELRIGTQTEVKKHPDSSKYYVTKIDIGYEVRQIVTGIQQHMPVSVINGKVIVASNLKTICLNGKNTDGLLMQASKKYQDGTGKTAYDIVHPHDEARLGERVYLDGLPLKDKRLEQAPSKLMSKMGPYLKTDCEGYACFRGKRLRTKSGFLKVTQIKDGEILT